MIKKLCAALMAVAVFTGCSKDDETPGTAPVGKLSKIEYEDGSYEAIAYDDAGRIKTVTNFLKLNGGGQTVKYNFSYTGNLLSEIKADDATKFVYTYNGQVLTKVDFYTGDQKHVQQYQYEYTDGRPTTILGFFDPNGNLPANANYRYEQQYFANGNLQKLTLKYRVPGSNQFDVLNEFTIDQYDDKKNTAIKFENNPFLPLELSPNNPLSEKAYYGGVLAETVTYTYTYDANGNPLTRKATTKVPGGQEYSETTKFFY